jgi:heme exporter protein C
MKASWKIRWAWLVVTLVLLGYGLLLALRISPPDADQGNMVRAFYYHFPNWIGASVFLPLNLVASLVYLGTRRKKPLIAMKADSLALASAEMGVLYCGLGLLTGSLWGRVEWGIWWTWDARLTTTFMLWLIYVSYLLVRKLVSSSPGVICAVLAVFGFCDMPIVYMSTRWWRTQHPAPVFGGGEGSGVAMGMQGAVWWNVLAWLAWGALIVSIRYSVELERQKVEEAKALEMVDNFETEGALHG